MKKINCSLLTIIIIFILALLFTPASYAQQAEKLAMVTSFEGETFIKSKTIKPVGEWVRLKKDVKAGYALYNGDSLSTKKGKAEIEFSDGSVVKLMENTNINIDESMKKRRVLGLWSSDYLSRTIRVVFGSLWANIQPSKEKTTEFESPTIVAGVRGTTLSFSYDAATGKTTIRSGAGDVLDVIDAGGSTRMTFQDGQIDISVDATTGEVSFASVSGSHTVVSADGTQANIDAGTSVGIRYDAAINTSTYQAQAGTVTVDSPDGSRASLTQGTGVSVTYDATTNSSTIQATSGNVTVTNPAGQSQTLGQGQQTQTQGPPPGAPGEEGAPPPPPPPPPDTTKIDTETSVETSTGSPAQ